MRKFAITLAAAAATLGLAAPASATWYVQPAYGYSHGYQNNYGQARNLQYRVDYLQRQLAQLAHQRIISRSEYYNLRSDSREIERRLYNSARYGFSRAEAYAIQRRIARLEYKIARDVRDGRRYAYSW